MLTHSGPEEFSELAHLYRTAPVGLCLIDPELRFVRINERLAAINGKPVREHIGRRVSEVLPEIGEEVEAVYREVLKTGEPLLDIEISGVTAANPEESRCWEVSYHPLKRTDGSVAGITAVVLDVTERKRAEAELARQQEELEARVEERTAELEQTRELVDRAARLVSIGTFAAGIAHQINNPLGGILLAAQSAQVSSGDAAIVDSALEDIVADVKRCGQIVRALLRFAREEALLRTPADLDEVVRSTAERARDRPGADHVSIEVHVAGSLPEVRLNADGIREVVQIAIDNSIDAGARSVRLGTEFAEGEARVTIQDDGEGITPELARRAFEPFFSTRQGSGGTGLGLSIAHGIVSQHGGTISIEGESGQGSTVTIKIPVDDDTTSS